MVSGHLQDAEHDFFIILYICHFSDVVNMLQT